MLTAARNQDADEGAHAGRDPDGVIRIIADHCVGLPGTADRFIAEVVEGDPALIEGGPEAFPEIREFFTSFTGGVTQRLFGFVNEILEFVMNVFGGS